HAVAASGLEYARLTGANAHIAILHGRAIARAAVIVGLVSVVTGFGTLEDTVATRHERRAQCPDRAAVVVAVPYRAVAAAPIAAGGVSVITGLEALDTAVAARQLRRAGASVRGAIEERFRL